MGGNTQTCQEAFALSQAGIMVAWTRVVAVEVMTIVEAELYLNG